MSRTAVKDVVRISKEKSCCCPVEGCIEKNTGIGFFEKYLTLWVTLCMAVGILIGKYLPVIPEFLSPFPCLARHRLWRLRPL